MKELSIEEKAKRYDEALERARIWKNKSGMPKDKQGILDDIFPELAESEDERIRKDIIWCLKHSGIKESNPINPHVTTTAKEAIAWLEKQAEHANFRNKIQIGDKVTRNEDGVLVNLSQLNRVAKVEEKQGEQKLSDIDNKFIRMRETKPKDISEFLDRLTTVEQEFLWEHIAKISELDKEEQKLANIVEPKFKAGV